MNTSLSSWNFCCISRSSDPIIDVKANINSGKFQPVRYGMVRFLLFPEYISCSCEEIFSENKRKRTIPYRTSWNFPEWILALTFCFLSAVRWIKKAKIITLFISIFHKISESRFHKKSEIKTKKTNNKITYYYVLVSYLYLIVSLATEPSVSIKLFCHRKSQKRRL